MTLSERIQKNYQDHLEGKINYLPFPDLGGFTKNFPGLMRGEVSCITGTPSSGKTSLLKWLVVYNGAKWAIKEKKNFRIIFFGLEESFQFFKYSLLSTALYDMFKLRYNIRSFECIGELVKPEHFPMIEQAEKRVETILKYVDYYDNTYNPFGMYRHVRDYAWEHGKFYSGSVRLTDLTQIKSDGWDRYEPNDPEEFVIPIIDNLNVLHPEKDKTEHQSIADIVEYMRGYAAKHFNYSPIFVHHQDSTTEGNENRRNKEVLCTLNALGKNKEVNRSYLNLIGISNLNRTNTVGDSTTGIQMWEGVHIPSMGNHSRVINILKNRFGVNDVNFLLYMDGKVGYFENLDKIKLNDYYQKVKSYKQ